VFCQPKNAVSLLGVYTSRMSNAAEQLISKWDYLEIERDGLVRHEWVGGQIYAMTGGSRVHNRISFRLARELEAAADPQGCQVFIADMKVLTDFAGYYPDVMVVCDTESSKDEYFEENPCLIAEVASKSTKDRDRREKWVAYKEITSLKHYLLISQEDTQIEHRYRTELGWSTEVLGPTDTLRLQCPKVEITVASLYEGLVTPL
jgi:Uma2 family endonuclease